ncbi:hypothetical protein QE152_g17012 [Popillia japonica]|uniref:Uncharacterized protein n=1 Tax=Popillia japonica TaxID=7064 RepID=A0AAW1L5E2_POPJA
MHLDTEDIHRSQARIKMKSSYVNETLTRKRHRVPEREKEGTRSRRVEVLDPEKKKEEGTEKP